MSFWWWVLVFVGIAAAGLALYAVLGLALWRKFRSLTADVGRLTTAMSEIEATIGAAGARPAGATAVTAEDGSF